MSSSSKTSILAKDVGEFDVDPQAGFMPLHEPLSRLPYQWEEWEATLDAAIVAKLQLGDKPGLSREQKATSEAWRARVRQLPLLSITELESDVLLRRAHLVLTYIQHFYIQSLPPDAMVIIPRPLSLPLLRVSARLDIAPLLTYSDTVLYNWTHETPAELPKVDNIRTKSMFSSLVDEEEFYLTSARIELRGVEALELIRVTMDEIFIGDQTAVRRITGYLQTLVTVINSMKVQLMDVRRACRPEAYYNEVRPWFRGEDSDINERRWVFEGLEEDPSLQKPTELSGPSAGQSSIVHVLDIFLGVDHKSTASGSKRSFMSRMQTYMPRNHRRFLNHLSENPRPLRAFVMTSGNAVLQEAYNGAVMALKEFRDAHMIIATLYIVGPARRAAAKAAIEARSNSSKWNEQYLKGTGGSDLVKFLKDTRNRTTETVIYM